MKPKPQYQLGDRIGGRYQVHQVKMGGMGEVYLCLDLEEMYPYALKTFQQRYQSQSLRRAFEKEVATWVTLEKHPNIVRCVGMDFLDYRPFLFLEWVASDERRGTDLRSWLGRGPLDLRLALDISIYICQGLIYASHKQPGIVHRDLKPENILIAQGNLAKITDWGLAKVVEKVGVEIVTTESEAQGRHSLFSQDSIVGTPPYMAPEQWCGEQPDQRTDIYAVGCILYEMLTDNQLFQARTLDDMRRQHLEMTIPRLTDCQNLPSGLDQLLTGCLTKQRDGRVASAADLLQQLVHIYQQLFAESPQTTSIGGQFTALDYVNRGFTYDQLQRYKEALVDYERAIQLDHTLIQIYYNRGLTYRNLHRNNEALADYNWAIQLDPTYAPAYNDRGITYYNLGQYEEALTDYDRAIQLDPTYAPAYSNRGLTYYDLQRYEEALINYNQAIQLNHTYADAYSNRGNLYRKLQQYREALVDHTRAIQLYPNQAEFYNNRGNTYYNLLRYDEALADYSWAIQLDPTYAVAYSNRGSVYTDLQLYDEALVDHAQAIRLNPTDALSYYNRGNTYYDLQMHSEALRDYTKAIELDPTYAVAYYNRGNIYDDLQHYNEALHDYERAIELYPQFAKAYFNRGVLYKNLGQADKALADYTRAIELDPQFAKAYSNRGNIYSDLGQVDKALADFNRAIELDPQYTLTYFNLGVLFVNNGKLHESLPYFEKAAQLGLSQATGEIAQIRQALGNDQQPGFFGRLFKKQK